MSNELFIKVRNGPKHAYQPWGRVNYDDIWSNGQNLSARPTYYFEVHKQFVTNSGLNLLRKNKLR